MQNYDKEYADAYKLKYKNYMDFDWKPYYPNNIVSNGLDGYDCIVEPEAECCRHFAIRFQYKTDTTGLRENTAEPEQYILFENGHFIYACPTLDFAKRRAYSQYAHIYGYVMSHIEHGCTE